MVSKFNKMVEKMRSSKSFGFVNTFLYDEFYTRGYY